MKITVNGKGIEVKMTFGQRLKMAWFLVRYPHAEIALKDEPVQTNNIVPFRRGE